LPKRECDKAHNKTKINISLAWLFVDVLQVTWRWAFLLLNRWFKGTLHPKMKIVSFTHPQVIANLYEFLNTKEDILND